MGHKGQAEGVLEDEEADGRGAFWRMRVWIVMVRSLGDLGAGWTGLWGDQGQYQGHSQAFFMPTGPPMTILSLFLAGVCPIPAACRPLGFGGGCCSLISSEEAEEGQLEAGSRKGRGHGALSFQRVAFHLCVNFGLRNHGF